MIRNLWGRFLARFRLSLVAVCEQSVGRGERDDYHDYPDDEHGMPNHFVPMKCVRCGKTFYI